MATFQELVLPQTVEHVILLKLLLLINLILFLPYMASVWGSLVLSAWYGRNGAKDRVTARLVIAVIDFLRDKRAMAYLLAVIPPLSLLTIHMQLLVESQTNIYPLFIWSTLLILIGMIYTFKYYEAIQFNNVELPSKLRERDDLTINQRSYSLAGAIGFLTAGMIFLLAAYGGIVEIDQLDKQPALISYIVSIPTILRVLTFMTMAMAMASAFAIYRAAFNFDDSEEERKAGIRKLSVFALGGISLLPVWAVGSFLYLPVMAYSTEVFLLITVGMFLAVGIALIYLGLIRETNFSTGIAGFYLFLITLATVIAADHMVLHNATYQSNQKLLAKAEAYEAEGMGGSATSYTPEELLAIGEGVYNNVCSACHKFDTRLVGPPYKEVLPKYLNDHEAMKAYIKNPQKINPDYPPMPAQALKPHELEGVVNYLLDLLEKR